MSRKTWFLIAFAMVLGSVYAYYFTDWINTPAIQIIKSDRPFRSPRANQDVYPITFTLDGRYELTSVKVFVASAYATNKNVPPLWYLVAKGRSEPVHGFGYGRPIKGMRPAVTNSQPGRLEVGINYLLLLDAGRARGRKEFRAQASE